MRTLTVMKAGVVVCLAYGLAIAVLAGADFPQVPFTNIGRCVEEKVQHASYGAPCRHQESDDEAPTIIGPRKMGAGHQR